MGLFGKKKEIDLQKITVDYLQQIESTLDVLIAREQEEIIAKPFKVAKESLEQAHELLNKVDDKVSKDAAKVECKVITKLTELKKKIDSNSLLLNEATSMTGEVIALAEEWKQLVYFEENKKAKEKDYLEPVFSENDTSYSIQGSITNIEKVDRLFIKIKQYDEMTKTICGTKEDDEEIAKLEQENAILKQKGKEILAKIEAKRVNKDQGYETLERIKQKLIINGNKLVRLNNKKASHDKTEYYRNELSRSITEILNIVNAYRNEPNNFNLLTKYIDIALFSDLLDGRLNDEQRQAAFTKIATIKEVIKTEEKRIINASSEASEFINNMYETEKEDYVTAIKPKEKITEEEIQDFKELFGVDEEVVVSEEQTEELNDSELDDILNG